MDYAHARVRLHFCKVLAWRGELQMREGQAMAWQTLPVTVAPVLPGTLPVLDWFAAEQAVQRADLRRLGRRRYTEPMRLARRGEVGCERSRSGDRPGGRSNDVLMFAFMNREALAKTAELGEAVYWSRSRGRLWRKGEESGNVQKVHGASPRLRQRRRPAQGRADRRRRRRADDRLPHRPPLVLLPALRERRLAGRRSGLERPGTHLQIAVRWTSAPPRATKRWHGSRA